MEPFIPLFPQCGINVNVLTDDVRTVSNLLCGISSKEVEEAIGKLNRVKPIALVRAHTQTWGSWGLSAYDATQLTHLLSLVPFQFLHLF